MNQLTWKQYRQLIPQFFSIKNRKGEVVPFEPNEVQLAYLRQLKNDYQTTQGIRENILKARQQGFSALIDAILTIDFLTQENCNGLIISHKKEETKPLLDRVSFYIDTFCERFNVNRDDLLNTDTQGLLINKTNGSLLAIGTAGARTLGRGGTFQNIHWSEIGFYSNTEKLDAEKLVAGAEQQVMTGVGKIFRESTGNVFDDYFHKECERSRKGESVFKFRFFPWYMYPDYQQESTTLQLTSEDIQLQTKYNLTIQQMYWYITKRTEFPTVANFLREYPTTPEEAFLTSGSSFFDQDILRVYFDNAIDPIREGNLAMDGYWS